RSAPAVPAPPVATAPLSGDAARDAFLAEIRKAKPAFYNMVVAQAQQIEFGRDRVVFSLLPVHRAIGQQQMELNRQWLEQAAAAVAGTRMSVMVTQVEAPGATDGEAPGTAAGDAKPSDLKTAAMADTTVQAMLDVFP